MKISLAYKHFLLLQPTQIWSMMRKRTSFNSTFDECFRSSFEHSDSFCGVFACDADCYEKFRCFFWPLISDFHRIDLRTFSFQHDFGEIQQISQFPTEITDRILSIRIRLNRSIETFPMTPKLTIEQFVELEQRIRTICSKFDDDLQGEYRSLNEIDENERENLRERKILFEVKRKEFSLFVFFSDESTFRIVVSIIFGRTVKIDRFEKKTQFFFRLRLGRGIFINKRENLFIWINEEDHLTVISQTNDEQMNSTYDRLIRATNRFNDEFDFQKHQRLGFLTCSPLNIGTTLQIHVDVKLFRTENFDLLVDLGKSFDLLVEKTTENDSFRISNRIRLGRTEFHLVRRMWNNIREILERDQQTT